MLWIISGPSSVGKSTFLSSGRCREITGVASAPTFFAFERDLPACGSDAFFHYNLLRPASRFRREHLARSTRWYQLTARLSKIINRVSPPELQKRAGDFRSDPAWHRLVTSGLPMQAIVLVADRNTIVERVKSRTTIEDQKLSAASNTYLPAEWLWLYERLDLTELYRAWYAELARTGVRYYIVDSSAPDFPVLEQQ